MFAVISYKHISTKNFHQKCFGRKYFMVAKSFPWEQVRTKNILQKFFGRKIFMAAKSFPREQV